MSYLLEEYPLDIPLEAVAFCESHGVEVWTGTHNETGLDCAQMFFDILDAFDYGSYPRMKQYKEIHPSGEIKDGFIVKLFNAFPVIEDEFAEILDDLYGEKDYIEDMTDSEFHAWANPNIR